MPDKLTLGSAEHRAHLDRRPFLAPTAEDLRGPPANAPSDLEVVRKAMCLADGHDCQCSGRGECLGAALYGDQAQAVVDALQAAGRLE